MATNASTWFYNDPEPQAYLLEERVNHTFWSNRITALALHCTSVEAPFGMEGEWRGMPISLEWVPKNYFKLTTQAKTDADDLIVGIKEILGFLPAISYVDQTGMLTAEWHVEDAAKRIQQITGNSSYRNIKRYEK